MSLSQEIEAKISIVDLVSRYVPLKKAGMNYKWLSPFVQEKTPSFVVSPAKNIAYCFSSHRGGGPIKFLMEIEHIEFREAVQILAKEAGVEFKTSFRGEKWEAQEDIYALYKKAAAWYHQSLFESENKKALQYLLDRNISLETITKFELGYSNNPRDMWYAMKEANFSDTFLIESGIFLSSSRDKFFGRIVFPIANDRGHVVGFTARVLDDGLPKYLNSPASPIFDKSSILYGFHLAKQEVARHGKIIIVEWQMDTITLHQAGITYAVGISGTALTERHIKILKRFVKEVYFCLDSDNAGVKATMSSFPLILNEDIDVKIISIPNGKDPDEFIRGWWVFQDLLLNAISPNTYIVNEGNRKFDMHSPIGKKQLLEECFAFHLKISSISILDQYFRELSFRLGISLDAIYQEFNQYKKTQRNKPIPSYLLQKSESETERKNIPIEISIFDKMAIYIEHFNFFDLFSANFRYTLDELSTARDFALLFSVLSHTVWDEDILEKKRLAELIVEEEVTQLSPALSEQTFLDMLRSLHRILFLQERDRMLFPLDPHSSEYLEVYQILMQQARSIGLPSNIMKE